MPTTDPFNDESMKTQRVISYDGIDLTISFQENERVWSQHPPEFGAPYKMRFVDDMGITAQFGVGIFMPSNGGEWLLWDDPRYYKGMHLVTYDVSTPLHFQGNPLQKFHSLITKNHPFLELPEVYRMEGYTDKVVFGKCFFIEVGDEIPMYSKRWSIEPLLTRYEELKKVGRDTYKVHCPVCSGGILLLKRDPNTFDIMPDDNCISCGQAFHYVDILPVGWVQKT